MSEITIREAREEDAGAIARLAALDESEMPGGAALLAFVDGELAVARSLRYGDTVADPFRRTSDVIDLLDLRAHQATAG